MPEPPVSSSQFLPVRYRDKEGLYGLWMITDSDPANMIGRDLYGEPKKLGKAQIYNEPEGARAIVSRGGERLIDFQGHFGAYDETVIEVDSIGFELKAQPAAGGKGFEYDPRLVAMNTHDRIMRRRIGKGSLTLRGTIHDPLDTIPIVEVLEATQTNAYSTFAAEVLETFSDHEAYIPYLYGRNFDDFTQLDRPERLRGKQ